MNHPAQSSRPHAALLTFAWTALVIAASCTCIAKTASAQTIDYFNDLPEIQMWTYPVPSGNGPGSVRDRGSMFVAYSETQDGTPTFFQGTGSEPTRRGSILVAANTSTTVPVVAPSRYKINSLKIKMTLLGSLILPEFGYTLAYDGTLDESAAVVAGTDSDVDHPIEMYGVAFNNGLTTFGFGSNPPAGTYSLRQPRWVGSTPYNYYAVDLNGRDAENSLVGGYSATEPSHTTAPFTPSPFAIGKAYTSQGTELQPGDMLDSGDVFEFVPNLSNPAVLAYIQNSLAQGHLGFTFSSLFEPDGQSSSVSYPDFYLDDLDVGANPNGAGPTIAMNVTILPAGPAGLAGDYNGNGSVDGADFLAWQRSFGTAATPAGSGADGNGNGSIDAGDLTVWKEHFGQTTNTPVVSVPEPTAGLLAMCGAAALLRGRRSRFSSR
ncbi:dockerin type I domain-containing protein [Lacipirellula parvula]|uniref:Dockerin domain-containing protein n=1 Tax=Lacipirellula parvula TaxID=2650471 RepID=A0A5K7XDL3_9BACT|nr:dockerin type I domain-containing protein [Lacipirellula parvula]BBO34904.1 hypothetical protein PLANPX_4516 [Lacipirellula parvula]